MHINATHLERIPTFADSKDRRIHAVIETPRDTRQKYVFEPDMGIFKLKAVLAEGLEWPYDYGFVPQTLADDGDPLDVLILSTAPTFTGCLVEARVLGLVRLCKDGTENDRLLSAPQRFSGIAQPSDRYDDVEDLPKEMIEGICRFLIDYSAEEGHKIEFKGVKSKKKAFEAIESTMAAYRKHKRAQ